MSQKQRNIKRYSLSASSSSQRQQGQIKTRHQSARIDPIKTQANDKKKLQIYKQTYTPPEVLKIIQEQLPDEEQFIESIKKILASLPDSKQPNEEKIKTYYQIYSKVYQQGGVVQVSSIGNFTKIVKLVLESLSNKMLNFQEVQTIRQILFSYEFIKKNPDIENKVYELGLVTFIGKEQLREKCYNKPESMKYFTHDLTLFQEGAQGLNINKYIFNLDQMTNLYRNDMIDIRIQNPCDYGFKPAKLKNKPYRMSLGDYRFYQQNYLQIDKMENFKHADMLGKGQIFFGVNFQPSDNQLNQKIKKHVGGTFLDFHSELDLLSYLDTDVPGCSLPQMYFKTQGCWTGGHQQNICMSALNINHGPDFSQWYTLDLCYVQKLRSELKQKFNVDLYQSQGLWYEKLDWFIKHGYPVKRFLQRKDDIVVTGPGTLHWVRSFGTALQTSWNIMPKTYEQLAAAFHRHKKNIEVNFSKSDTIPLKSLIIKYLNHERITMPGQNRQICSEKLQEWLQEQESILEKFSNRVRQKNLYYLKDLESFCCLCKQQILNYYVPAPKQKKCGISCLRCFDENPKNPHQIDTLFSKYGIYFLQHLIELSKDPITNKQYPYELKELCKGNHVGKIPRCRVVDQKQAEAVYFEFKDNKQVQKQSRNIFFKNIFLFDLYQSINQLKQQINPLKQKLAEVGQNQSIQQKTDTAQKKDLVDTQCQTDDIKFKILDEESQRSRSRDKKKKKHKEHKHKKHKRQRENSPKFSRSGSNGNWEEKKFSGGWDRESKRDSNDNWANNNQDRGSWNNQNTFSNQNSYKKGNRDFGGRDQQNFKSRDSFRGRNNNNFGGDDDGNNWKRKKNEGWNKNNRNGNNWNRDDNNNNWNKDDNNWNKSDNGNWNKDNTNWNNNDDNWNKDRNNNNSNREGNQSGNRSFNRNKDRHDNGYHKQGNSFGERDNSSANSGFDRGDRGGFNRGGDRGGNFRGRRRGFRERNQDGDRNRQFNQKQDSNFSKDRKFDQKNEFRSGQNRQNSFQNQQNNQNKSAYEPDQY